MSNAVELQIFRDENGRILESHADNVKADNKRIKLKNLGAEKNLAQLAADIVDKCKYLHSSRTEELEQILIKLKKFVISNPPVQVAVADPQAQGGSERGGGGGGNRGRDEGDRGNNRRSSSAVPEKPKSEEDLLPDAHMSELDDYLEMLYQVYLLL